MTALPIAAVPGQIPLAPADTAVAIPRVSVVMPCLNEARTLAACIVEAREAMEAAAITGEILVADNGSTDGSQAIAAALGARVVHVSERGYGAALRGGIAAATGEWIIMGDADQSYDFTSIPRFVQKLAEGHQLVMGNRFKGGIERNAMRWSHRYVGNPVLSWLGRALFSASVRDFHCGLRAFRKADFELVGLRTSGMEFASEMVIKASLHRLSIAEIPTVLRKDGRDRPPHLRTWSDGWRHLRFMLLYSPRWLFFVPGLSLLALGAGLGLWLIPGPRVVGRFGLDIHTLLVAGFMCIVGFQLVVFAAFSKVFCIREGLHPPSPSLERLFRYIRLETGLLLGAAMTVAGAAVLFVAFGHWARADFGALDPRQTMREAIPAVVLLALGVQTIFASFFLSVLGVSAPAARPQMVTGSREHPRVAVGD